MDDKDDNWKIGTTLKR
jgi:hypothetical protein